MAEAEERHWEILTHKREKRQRRPGTSQSGHNNGKRLVSIPFDNLEVEEYDDGIGGGDVLASKFEKLDLDSDLSQFKKPKKESTNNL